MKKFAVLLGTLGLLLFAVQPASAVSQNNNCCKVDCNKINKLPHVVACYEEGSHGIPGQAEYHSGADWVKSYLEGKMLYQYFCGQSESEGYHREIAIWKVAKNDKCPANWLLYKDPYPEWGYYLVPGEDYCIKTITLPCVSCQVEKPCTCDNFGQ